MSWPRPGSHSADIISPTPKLDPIPVRTAAVSAHCWVCPSTSVPKPASQSATGGGEPGDIGVKSARASGRRRSARAWWAYLGLTLRVGTDDGVTSAYTYREK